MLEFDNPKKFLLQYKKLNKEQLQQYYSDYQFWLRLFQVSENNYQTLLIVLSNLPQEIYNFMPVDLVMDELTNIHSLFKIKLLFRYCKNSTVMKQILLNKKMQKFIQQNLKICKKILGEDFLLKNVQLQIPDSEKYLYFISLEHREVWLEEEDNKNIITDFIKNKDLELSLLFPKYLSQVSAQSFFAGQLEEYSPNHLLSFLGQRLGFSEQLFENEKIKTKLTSYEISTQKKKNPYLFRYFIQCLYDRNVSATTIFDLEERKRKNTEEAVNGQEMPISDLAELITDYFFQDYYDNVVSEINIIENFCNEDPVWQSKIGMKSLHLMKEFVEVITSQDKLKIISYFNQHKQEQYFSMLYDSLYLARTLSSKEICDSVTTVDQMLCDNSVLKRKENGVLIVELFGQDFTFFIHKSLLESFKEENPYEDITSLSLISERNPVSSYELEGAIHFGFTNVPFDHIIHICSHDSFSLINFKNQHDIMVYSDPEYVKKDTLIDRTGQEYNEFVVLNKNKETQQKDLFPTFILVYDKISEQDILVAKKNNLPIVKVNLEYYKAPIGIDLKKSISI